MMPAHPNITSDESRQIALYIQSLVSDGTKKLSLPVNGKILPEAKTPGEMMVITASYTDGGVDGVIPLTGSKSIALSSNTIGFSKATKTQDMSVVTFGGQDLLVLQGESGWFEIEEVDLTGVQMIVLAAGWQEAPKVAYKFNVRLDSPDGEILGEGMLAVQPARTPGAGIVLPLTRGIKEKHKLYITGSVENGAAPSLVALMSATFN
jgi:hypothetical protein